MLSITPNAYRLTPRPQTKIIPYDNTEWPHPQRRANNWHSPDESGLQILFTRVRWEFLIFSRSPSSVDNTIERAAGAMRSDLGAAWQI